MRLLALALCAALVGGCVLPAPLPPTQPPLPPGPLEPPPGPVEPPPDSPGGLEGIEPGMARGAVEGLLGPPSADPPENPGEDDLVRYDVALDGGWASWFIAYRNGLVWKLRMARIGVAP